MVILSKVDPRTHYATGETKTSVGCLHVFDYILWFSYNTETKAIQFNCPNTSCLLQCVPLHQKNLSLTTAMFPNYFPLQRRKSWHCSIFLGLWASVLPTQTFKHLFISACLIFFELSWYVAQIIGRPRRRVFCK